MCESGLRTIRCKSKSLKGGFFCVHIHLNFLISKCNKIKFIGDR